MKLPKTITIRGYDEFEGCPFCGNESEYDGESVLYCTSTNKQDYKNYYKCEKCNTKWQVKTKTIVTDIMRLTDE